MNNNSFLKRQKELKRKEKQKEKEVRKAARKQGQGGADESSDMELVLDASGLTGVGADGATAVVPGLAPSASGDSVVRAVGEPPKD
jgi:hypothetical protein